MTFIRLPHALMAAALEVPLAFGGFASNAQAETVLRVIPHADLKNFDPIWTTAYISRNHGYMVYDTLFAMDEAFTPQPQMVDVYICWISEACTRSPFYFTLSREK